MSDVKRYSLSDDYDGHDNYAGQFLRDDDTGDYVKAVDFDALQRERDGLASENETLRAQVEAALTRQRRWASARDGLRIALEEIVRAALSGGSQPTRALAVMRDAAQRALKASGGGEVTDAH